MWNACLWLVVVGTLFGLAACSSPAIEPVPILGLRHPEESPGSLSASSTVGVNSSEACAIVEATQRPRLDGLSPIVIAIRLAESQRSLEAQCGPPLPEDVICRALWMALALDPVVVAQLEPGQVAAASDLRRWAVEKAVAVSSPREASVLEELDRLNSRLAELDPIDAANDQERADLIIERSAPDLLAGLDVMQSLCDER